LLIFVSVLRAEDAAKLTERLHAADTGSSLDSPDLKPWHLKMTVQLFDETGKATDTGTIEEWWAGPGTDRREYKTGTYSATEVRTDNKLYRTKDAGSPPYYQELLREQVVHPMPKTVEVDGSTPEVRKERFGEVFLDCIMLSQPIKRFGLLPLGLFPTYCFDPGKDVLRASFEFGQQMVLRNSLEEFQGKAIARDVAVRSGTTVVATAQVVKLEGVVPPDEKFAVSDDLLATSPGAVRVSSGVVAANLLTRPGPIYPESAKKNHTEGAVIMHAVIGADGHIHSLKIVSAPDSDLAISAIAAVSRWTYKPYLLQGMPVDVDTTITVKYTFGP
jgi:TonB family protein